MKKVFMCAMIAGAGISAVSAQTKSKTVVKPSIKPGVTASKATGSLAMKNLNDSFSYAAGLNIAGSMKQQGITKINSALMTRAITDVMSNNKQLLLTQEQATACLQQQLQAFSEKKNSAEKSSATAFLELNRKKQGVISLPNGLQYEVLKAAPSGGIKPVAIDTVVVHYVGKLTNGTEFDNSVSRGEPATFPLNGVIKGWTEILQLMSKGDKWRVVIPSELGYGERGAGAAIPGNATLIFEIELLDIKPAKK